ncbi:MAG: MFS transporter [Luteitalea sp.]|nr:MFS transporter [Luteitalea sp.]
MSQPSTAFSELEGASRTRRALPPVRWVIAVLLMLASVMNYVDRQALSILASTIQQDLGIDDAGYTMVVQAFLLCYAVMYLFSGRIVDRIGTRLAETAFITWWSVANMFTALATGVFSLALFRSLLGIAEPGNYTASAKAVSEWFPAREKGIAVGMYSMGGTIGAAVAAPLVAFLALHFGWRSAFVFTGVLGLVLAAVWYVVYRGPAEHRLLGDAERRLLESEGLLRTTVSAQAGAVSRAPSGTNQPNSPLAWRDLLALRPMWLVLLARMLTDPLWYFYLFWLPKYLQDERGFSLADLGKTVWIVFLAADLGCILGGWLSGHLIRRGVDPVQARLRVMAGSAVVLAASFTLPATAGAAVPLAMASLFTCAHMAWMTNSTTLPMDIFPVRAIGSVQGAIGAGSSFGGFASTAVVGFLVTHYGYAPVFRLMSVLHPVAWAALAMLLPRAVRDFRRAV